MMHYVPILWRCAGDKLPEYHDISFAQLMDKYIYPSASYENEPKTGETRFSYKCIYVNSIQSYLTKSTVFPMVCEFVVYTYTVDTETQRICEKSFMFGNDLPSIFYRIMVANRTSDTHRHIVVGVWFEYDDDEEFNNGFAKLIYDYSNGYISNHVLASWDFYSKLPYVEGNASLNWLVTQELDSSYQWDVIGDLTQTIRICKTSKDLDRFIMTLENVFDKIAVTFRLIIDKKTICVTGREFCRHIYNMHAVIAITTMADHLETGKVTINSPICMLCIDRTVLGDIVKDVFCDDRYHVIAIANVIPGSFNIVTETIPVVSYDRPKYKRE